MVPRTRRNDFLTEIKNASMELRRTKQSQTVWLNKAKTAKVVMEYITIAGERFIYMSRWVWTCVWNKVSDTLCNTQARLQDKVAYLM